jgi:hypothetical protein
MSLKIIAIYFKGRCTPDNNKNAPVQWQKCPKHNEKKTFIAQLPKMPNNNCNTKHSPTFNSKCLYSPGRKIKM